MEDLNKEFVSYLEENKDELKKAFEETLSDIIPEVATSYGFEEEALAMEEEGLEYNEWDWYEDYGYTTGNQAEWETSEHIAREYFPGIDLDRDHLSYLIEFLGYKTF